jgi:NADPH:quinone reductase-like Zn-dependent oxidoreductase
VVKDDEVLVHVHAASVNTADWRVMRGLPYIMRGIGSGLGFGMRKPKHTVLGRDMAGQVEAVGKDVTQLQPGDEVYGEIPGAFAEYLSASESALAPKPADLTFEQAAAMPIAAVTALQGLRDHGRIQPGQMVLINGASGGVGTFAVQIAKAFGGKVTGVCSTGNVEMVRSIGADQVVDYTQEDFTQRGERYDLFLDLVGNHSFSDCRRALTPRGRLILSYGGSGRWIGPIGQILGARAVSPFVSQTMLNFTARTTKEDLVALKELAEDGEVTPVIDRTYPLSETAEAIRYIEEGHTRGKVVITV